jgi:hypothetical protein
MSIPTLDHTMPPWHAMGPHIRIDAINHIYIDILAMDPEVVRLGQQSLQNKSQ